MNKVKRLALYLFLFSINFEVWDPFHTGGSFSIAKFLGFIYLFTMIPEIPYFSTVTKAKRILFPIILFFLLLTFVNMLNPEASPGNIISFTILQNIFLLWMLVNHERKDPLILEKGLLFFALGSILQSMFVLFNIGIAFSDDGRLTIFGDNQNTVGIRVCITLIILIVNIIQNPLSLPRIRLILLLPIPSLIMFMISTGSRVAILAFLLSLIVGAILFRTNKGKYKFIYTSLMILLFFVFRQFLINSEATSTRIMQSIIDQDLSGRDILWSKLIPMIMDHPILGIGNVGYISLSISIFGHLKSPHNVILEILCYTGIVGLSMYMYFLFLILKKSIQIFHNSSFMLSLLLLIPIAGLLLSGQLLEVKIGWIIFAYIAGNSGDET